MGDWLCMLFGIMRALYLFKFLIVSNVMVVEEGGGGTLPYLPTPFLTALVVRMVFGIKYHGGLTS